MFDPLDILLGALAVLAVIAATTALYSPAIAYWWVTRAEVRDKMDGRRGFPVIDPHPAGKAGKVVSEGRRAENPTHVYPLREFLVESPGAEECTRSDHRGLPKVPGSDPDCEASLGRRSGQHAA
jgi:hypothetical protein